MRSDLSFLDLTVQQIEHLNKTFDADVPLILMNSFNTDADTQKIIRKYAGFKVRIITFNQVRQTKIVMIKIPLPSTFRALEST